MHGLWIRLVCPSILAVVKHQVLRVYLLLPEDDKLPICADARLAVTQHTIVPLGETRMAHHFRVNLPKRPVHLATQHATHQHCAQAREFVGARVLVKLARCLGKVCTGPKEQVRGRPGPSKVEALLDDAQRSARARSMKKVMLVDRMIARTQHLRSGFTNAPRPDWRRSDATVLIDHGLVGARIGARVVRGDGHQGLHGCAAGRRLGRKAEGGVRGADTERHLPAMPREAVPQPRCLDALHLAHEQPVREVPLAISRRFHLPGLVQQPLEDGDLTKRVHVDPAVRRPLGRGPILRGPQQPPPRRWAPGGQASGHDVPEVNPLLGGLNIGLEKRFHNPGASMRCTLRTSSRFGRCPWRSRVAFPFQVSSSNLLAGSTCDQDPHRKRQRTIHRLVQLQPTAPRRRHRRGGRARASCAGAARGGTSRAASDEAPNWLGVLDDTALRRESFAVHEELESQRIAARLTPMDVDLSEQARAPQLQIHAERQVVEAPV
mmetsp:Transcript_167917/g.533994  ORF Transcript_167917/g.533994 Transcript_167917/m.533994 type:complete len:491 (-) Transcript_167917:202-1674(-)